MTCSVARPDPSPAPILMQRRCAWLWTRRVARRPLQDTAHPFKGGAAWSGSVDLANLVGRAQSDPIDNLVEMTEVVRRLDRLVRKVGKQLPPTGQKTIKHDSG